MRLRMYGFPSSALYSRRTVCALIVMPRSRSMSIESSTCSTMSRTAIVPVCWMRRSASVDLPWSIWAMIAKFRIFSIEWAVIGRGIAGRAREGNGIRARRRRYVLLPSPTGEGWGVRVSLIRPRHSPSRRTGVLPDDLRRGHLTPWRRRDPERLPKTREAAQENTRAAAVFSGPVLRPGRLNSLLRRHGEGRLAVDEVEAIEVHHLDPRLHEVLHELLLPVGRSIDLRKRAQNRVRAEDEIDACAAPLDFTRLPVAPLVDAFRTLGRLPFRAHVEQVDEEVVGQRPRLLGEDAVLGPSNVSAKCSQAAYESRHLRRGQPEQLRLVDQRFLGRHELLGVPIVAETVGSRFEHADRLHIRLLLRGVRASGCEGDLHVMAGILRGFLDRRSAAKHDQVGQRDLLAAFG